MIHLQIELKYILYTHTVLNQPPLDDGGRDKQISGRKEVPKQWSSEPANLNSPIDNLPTYWVDWKVE